MNCYYFHVLASWPSRTSILCFSLRYGTGCSNLSGPTITNFVLRFDFCISGVYLDRRILKSRIMYSKHLLSKITTSCNRSVRLYSALPAPNTNPKIEATGVSTVAL